MADIRRKAGVVNQATYFNWKKKYDNLLSTEMRRLKPLENSQPRRGGVAGRALPKAYLSGNASSLRY